jgi:G:T/U-mismatch repair DNA glycosylase
MVKVDMDLHRQYRISFTNYVKTASKNEKSLTAEEMLEGKQRLMTSIEKWQPQVVCFLGLKCIKHFLYTKHVVLGGQSNYKGIRLYCLPSTSSIGVAYSFEKKKE